MDSFPNFFDGFNQARGSLNRYQRDIGLANIERGFNADGSAQSGNSIGLESLNGQTPGDMTSPASPTESTRTPGGALGMPQFPTMDPGLVNAQRRASLMRATGDPEGANKELQAQAQLGLTGAQLAREQAGTAGLGIKNKVDQTNLDRQTRADLIDQGIAAELQTRGVDPSTSMGAVTAGAMRVQKLSAAGLFDHAKGAAGTMQATQANLLTTQTADRAEAANRIAMAAKGGQLTPDLIGAFHDKYVPDGTSTTGVRINADGGFSITTKDDATGASHVQTVRGADVPSMYEALGSADSAGMIAKQLAAANHAKLVTAQTNHANASAGAAGASAAFTRQQSQQYGVEAARGNATFDARKAIAALPEGADIPPALQAQVDAADQTAISKRARVDPNGTQDIRALTAASKGNVAEIAQLTKQLQRTSSSGEDGKPNPARVAIQAQLDAATQRRTEISAGLMALTRSGDSTSTPTAATTAISTGGNLPPINALAEGKVTTFGNGQAWTLQGGKPVQVR